MCKSEEILGYTNFKTALYWCNNEFVLMNKVPELDFDVVSEYESWYREQKVKEGYTEEEADEMYPEVYQWLVTDANEYDIEYLEESFGIKSIWSNVLECWVVPVDHFGTSWDCVAQPVYNKNWWEINKEEHEYKH